MTTDPTLVDRAKDQAVASTKVATDGRFALFKMWIRLVIFFLPLLILVGLPVYTVDPYGLFADGESDGDSAKQEVASRVNQVLLGLVKFSKNPAPNLILGDSQMTRFKVDQIESITHESYDNLAYGGGTLAESVATFWYATRKAKLRRVYFGMSFYSFTDNSRNRVEAAVRVVESPWTYFLNGDVLEATWDEVSSRLLHHRVQYLPEAGAAQFWQQQLSELTRRKQTYAASQRTIAQIRAIVEYCRLHNIEIEFIIPPEHEDVHKRIEQLRMQDAYKEFKSTVFGLGPTVDCDIGNDFTRDPANFQDPFHTTVAAGELLTRGIWSREQHWCDVVRADRP